MILLDSSFIVAYSNERDQNHAKASEIAKAIDDGKYGIPAVTDYIFDEVVTVMLSRTGNLPQVVDLGEKLLKANRFLRIDEEIFQSAWEAFANQRNRRLSFTDCTCFEICESNGISIIATFDGDFAGVGSIKLVGV